MKIYELKEVQKLPLSIEKAWDFFSSPANLAVITPPELGFVIHTNLTDAPIHAGMVIDYTVRPLLNIPMNWRTEIREVDAPARFTDVQAKGPYALWEHTHTFVAIKGGVEMTDHVRYALPLGLLGVLAHGIVVSKKLEQIFEFRKSKLKQLFGDFK